MTTGGCYNVLQEEDAGKGPAKVPLGLGLIGEYDDAKDDAGERPAGVLLCTRSNLEDYMMI